MKALKSDLAKTVLSDPKAKGQLRTYLASKSGTFVSGGGRVPSSGRTVIEVRSDGTTVRVEPVVVPKAAA